MPASLTLSDRILKLEIPDVPREQLALKVCKTS